MSPQRPDPEVVAAWIDADPDPTTRAELAALDDAELARRFDGRLHFGTAGIRGPVRAGPNGMNRAVVARTTAALARWLQDHGHRAATVVVARDARHGSEEFAAQARDVLQGAGFDVVALPGPVPTPVLAFTTRRLGAAAGIMITASHNPPVDNGYKVYLGGDHGAAGAQLVPPADAEIESLVDDPSAPPAPADSPTTRESPDPRADGAVTAYLERLAARFPLRESTLRVALTPLHGVGGELAVAALAQAGIGDVTVVAEQFRPDPDFPTVAYPNPEEDGAADRLLDLARAIDADIAVALDPDADRCAVGAVIDGSWRMLTGDETGALLAAEIVSERSDPAADLIATTLVSGSLVERVCASVGARFTRTLTGFKWLVRAGTGLVYAYEEAIGHCVDPDHVRDKDGISAAVALALLAHRLRARGSDLAGALTDLHLAHGVHRTGQVAVRVEDPSEIAEVMAGLRRDPPPNLPAAGIDALTMTDHAARSDELATDAVEFGGSAGGTRIRMIARPSGTEPKIKFYLEVARGRVPAAELAADLAAADGVLANLRVAAADLVASYR